MWNADPFLAATDRRRLQGFNALFARLHAADASKRKDWLLHMPCSIECIESLA